MPATRRAALLAKDLGGLALYYPGAWLLRSMPRRAIEPAATLGAGLVARLQPGDRAEMEDELRRLFGTAPLPESPATIARSARRLAMFNELEVLRYPWLSPDTIHQVATIQGRENLDRAIENGRGAILLIGHFGANQMIMPALGHAGYPMNQLSAPPTVWADILRDTRTTPLWEKVLARRWELEQRLPVRHINVFKLLRPAFRCLAQNEVLGLAFDGGGGNRWVTVDFMARRANVSVQPFQLWRRSGATLLPTLVVRREGASRHQVIIEPPLAWTGASLQANAQAFVSRFEPWVARHPDHYLHFMLMRRRVRSSDSMPFFEDYPDQ